MGGLRRQPDGHVDGRRHHRPVAATDRRRLQVLDGAGQSLASARLDLQQQKRAATDATVLRRRDRNGRQLTARKR